MKWEYLFLETPVSKDFGTWLNGYGEQGWELNTAVQGMAQGLAGVAPMWICIFKRKAFKVENSRALGGTTLAKP